MAMATELNEKIEYGDKKSNAEPDTLLSSPHNEKAALDQETIEGGITRNGVKLHPQPTSDPLDLLN